MTCQAKQGQKNMKKLDRAQKCSILGSQNLGLRGWPPGPGGSPPRSASAKSSFMHPAGRSDGSDIWREVLHWDFFYRSIPKDGSDI